MLIPNMVCSKKGMGGRWMTHSTPVVLLKGDTIDIFRLDNFFFFFHNVGMFFA